MSIEILESGLTFGPFEEDLCWRIEDAPLYLENQTNVKMVDFLLVREALSVSETCKADPGFLKRVRNGLAPLGSPPADVRIRPAVVRRRG